MERRYHALKIFRKFVFWFSRNARRLDAAEEQIEEINKALLNILKDMNEEKNNEKK